MRVFRETYSMLCKVYGGEAASTNFLAPTKLSYYLVWLLLRRHLGPPRRGRRCPWRCHVGLSVLTAPTRRVCYPQFYVLSASLTRAPGGMGV
jgi:hypothetical protein